MPGYTWLSLAIPGTPGYPWLSLASHGAKNLILGYPWLCLASLAIPGYPWHHTDPATSICVGTFGYAWLSWAIPGYPWPPWLSPAIPVIPRSMERDRKVTAKNLVGDDLQRIANHSGEHLLAIVFHMRHGEEQRG